jgi:hypothetical protein
MLFSAASSRQSEPVENEIEYNESPGLTVYPPAAEAFLVCAGLALGSGTSE